MAEPQTSLVKLDTDGLIRIALEKGAEVGTMERLFTLAKEVRAEQAREAWYRAMAEFQARCPVIKKTATAKITTTRGSYAYAYAPLDEILSTIHPIMGPLGLSISWRSRLEPNAVVVNCRIAHQLGHHEESGEMAIPLSTDERGANPAQRVGSATTYAKRYSLLGIIGMAPEDDDDAASPPPPTTEAEPPTSSPWPAQARTQTPKRAPWAPTSTPGETWEIPFVAGTDDQQIKALADELGLTPAQRLEMARTYMDGKPIDKASKAQKQALKDALVERIAIRDEEAAQGPQA